MGTFIRPPSGPPAYTLPNLPGAPGMNTTPSYAPGSYTGAGGVRQGIADAMPAPHAPVAAPSAVNTGGLNRVELDGRRGAGYNLRRLIEIDAQQRNSSGMIPTPDGGIDRRLPSAPQPQPMSPVPQGPVTPMQPPVKAGRRNIADLLAQVQDGGG